MDQIIIGKFIASERKRKGYTQRQLADLLQISDKTISKWERGNGFPEVSLLLPLCRELDITVNELLSGERVSEEDYQKDYQQKAEENMVKMSRTGTKQKESNPDNYFRDDIHGSIYHAHIGGWRIHRSDRTASQNLVGMYRMCHFYIRTDRCHGGGAHSGILSM